MTARINLTTPPIQVAAPNELRVAQRQFIEVETDTLTERSSILRIAVPNGDMDVFFDLTPREVVYLRALLNGFLMEVNLPQQAAPEVAL